MYDNMLSDQTIVFARVHPYCPQVLHRCATQRKSRLKLCTFSVCCGVIRSTEQQAYSMGSSQLLKGKVCVVTGGGRGIGAAIAEKYAAQGATLIPTARSEDQLQEVCCLSACRSAVCTTWLQVAHNLTAVQSERMAQTNLCTLSEWEKSNKPEPRSDMPAAGSQKLQGQGSCQL